MSNWYITKVIPGKERQLTEQLNTQIKTEKINFIKRFVCPTEKSFVLAHKKKVLREKVIYVGYLYFEAEKELNNDQLMTISTYPSIMGMFGDKKALKMSNFDISRILKDELLEDHEDKKIIKFYKGETVQINEGPFASFNGKINSINNDKVELIVSIFGRETPTIVDINQITKNQYGN